MIHHLYIGLEYVTRDTIKRVSNVLEPLRLNVWDLEAEHLNMTGLSEDECTWESEKHPPFWCLVTAKCTTIEEAEAEWQALLKKIGQYGEQTHIHLGSRREYLEAGEVQFWTDLCILRGKWAFGKGGILFQENS
jgi:hypothetical protein